MKILFAVLSAVLFVPVCQALPLDSGSGVGNGGQSVVCRNRAGRILQAESFDLFEGKALFSYSYRQTGSSDALGIALAILEPLSLEREERGPTLSERARYVNGAMKMLPAGRKLSLTHDIRTFVLPSGCKLEQAVIFYDDGTILADPEIWNALPELSRAALLVHESIYWYLRDFRKETDSRRTRRLTSYLFGASESLPRPASILTLIDVDVNVQLCRSRERRTNNGRPGTSFFAYISPAGAPVFLFTSLGGEIPQEREIWTGPRGVCSNPLIDPRSGDVTELSHDYRRNNGSVSRLTLRWGQGLLELVHDYGNGRVYREDLVCQTQESFL